MFYRLYYNRALLMLLGAVVVTRVLYRFVVVGDSWLLLLVVYSLTVKYGDLD